MFTHLRYIFLAALLGGITSSAFAQAVTVVEYYNKALDAYFVSGRSGEQAQLDGAGGFQRTGMSFQAVDASTAPTGLTRICRFYIGTTSPVFSSSHFYGREGADCEGLLAQNLPGFSWEGYDFALAQPVNGACPAGTTTIYRSFRPSADAKTPNHRYSASLASYNANAARGYNGEQAVFCASSATDVTTLTVADCGTLYYPGLRVTYDSLTDTGVAKSWVRSSGLTQVPFNGQQATPVFERYTNGLSTTIMIQDATDSWTGLGAITEYDLGPIRTYYLPATVFPRRMVAGQSVVIDRYVAYDPTQSFGSPHQTGTIALAGTELVTVPAGTYAACKFTSQVTSRYAAISRTELSTTTAWVAPGVGVVKSVIVDSVLDDFGPYKPLTTEVNAASAVRL